MTKYKWDFWEKLCCILHSAGVQEDAVNTKWKATDTSTAFRTVSFVRQEKKRVTLCIILSFLIDNQTYAKQNVSFKILPASTVFCSTSFEHLYFISLLLLQLRYLHLVARYCNEESILDSGQNSSFKKIN